MNLSLEILFNVLKTVKQNQGRIRNETSNKDKYKQNISKKAKKKEPINKQ